MNKKGYTLAEALITLGIIGIIAALVVPAANKARPNQNKIKFLQTYDTIETQIKNFTQNSRYFPTCQDGFPDPNNPEQFITRCFPDYPLYNTSAGVIEDGAVHGLLYDIMNQRDVSDNKLCYLLADAMGGQVVIDNGCKFRTSNGVYFAMGVTPNFRRQDRPFMVTNILFNVDIDTNKELNNNNQTWDIDPTQIISLTEDEFNNNGNVPDTRAFALFVFSDGTIIPGTRATAYYLATRNNQRDNNIPINDPSVRNIIINKYGNEYDFLENPISTITYMIDRPLLDTSSFSQ